MLMERAEGQTEESFEADVFVRSLSSNEQRKGIDTPHRLAAISEAFQRRIPDPRMASALSLSATQYGRLKSIVENEWMHELVEKNELGTTDAATLLEAAKKGKVDDKRLADLRRTVEGWVEVHRHKLGAERTEKKRAGKELTGTANMVKKYASQTGIVRHWVKSLLDPSKPPFNNPHQLDFGVIVDEQKGEIFVPTVREKAQDLSADEIEGLMVGMAEGARRLAPLYVQAQRREANKVTEEDAAQALAVVERKARAALSRSRVASPSRSISNSLSLRTWRCRSAKSRRRSRTTWAASTLIPTSSRTSTTRPRTNSAVRPGVAVVPPICSLNHSPEECRRALLRATFSSPIILDLETTGLGRRRHWLDQVVAVGLLIGDAAHVLIVRSSHLSCAKYEIGEDQLRHALQPLADRRDLTLVLHNAMFDLGFLRAAGVRISGTVFDTIHMLKLIDSDRGREDGKKARKERRYDQPLNYKLKDVVLHDLDIKSPHFPGQSDLVSYDILVPYLMCDLVATSRLFAYLQNQLPPQTIDYYRHFVAPVTPLLVEMAHAGVGADCEFVAQEADRLRLLMSEISAKHVARCGQQLDVGDYALRYWVYRRLRCPVRRLVLRQTLIFG